MVQSWNLVASVERKSIFEYLTCFQRKIFLKKLFQILRERPKYTFLYTGINRFINSSECTCMTSIKKLIKDMGKISIIYKGDTRTQFIDLRQTWPLKVKLSHA